MTSKVSKEKFIYFTQQVDFYVQRRFLSLMRPFPLEFAKFEFGFAAVVISKFFFLKPHYSANVSIKYDLL